MQKLLWASILSPTRILILSILSIAACAPKIYQAPDFDRIARKHQTLAILPASVSIKLRPKQAKDISPQQLADEEKDSGLEIQNSIYTWLLRRSSQQSQTVKLQDVARTNSLLQEAGIEYMDLQTADRARIAQVLGVDALLSNASIMEKPMSEGAALTVGILVGVWGSTNKVNTTLSIHDGKSGDLMWKYDFISQGSVGSSIERLVNALMRNASRKFPYKR
jgi:hypothetical protein